MSSIIVVNRISYFLNSPCPKMYLLITFSISTIACHHKQISTLRPEKKLTNFMYITTFIRRLRAYVINMVKLFHKSQKETHFDMVIIFRVFYIILIKSRRPDSVLWRKPLYQQKIQKQINNTKTPPKPSITQQLLTDLERSAGVTTVMQLVWSNRFTDTQPSH